MKLFSKKNIQADFKEKGIRTTVIAKPGDLFKSVTGKSVAECKTIDEVDAAVGKALNIKGPIPFSGVTHGFVVRSGDIFPHVSMGKSEELDEKIAHSLSLDKG